MPIADANGRLQIRVIDTHTAGEPTRIVIDGGPDLGVGPLSQRRDFFRERFDHYRSAIVNEPRGSAVMVGALLVPPVDPRCASGVIFFNNVGYLGMCGHGTIGVAVALAHAGRIVPGAHRLETPVGEVGLQLSDRNTVTIENVASYRSAKNVTVDIPQFGQVTGDVAWGGNWFFLVQEAPYPVDLAHVDELTAHSWAIRQALSHHKITGKGGAEIDHVEVFSPPRDPRNHSRSFVLCPGRAYDRSPCGTGTSAKLACLYADGKLRPGEVWRQESVIGSVFEGSVRIVGQNVIPVIRGTAYVNGEATLHLDPADPFRWGIASS